MGQMPWLFRKAFQKPSIPVSDGQERAATLKIDAG